MKIWKATITSRIKYKNSSDRLLLTGQNGRQSVFLYTRSSLTLYGLEGGKLAKRLFRKFRYIFLLWVH